MKPPAMFPQVTTNSTTGLIVSTTATDYLLFRGGTPYFYGPTYNTTDSINGSGIWNLEFAIPSNSTGHDR